MTTFVDTSALYALLDADDAFHEPALVDLCSFHIMRRLGLRAAFTFDEDFRQQGFDAVPG